MMRGRSGTQVKLLIRRPDSKQSFEVDLARTKIDVPSIKTEVLDEKYGYVSIMAFQEGTVKDFRKAIKKLAKQNALNGIIIDIRKNPGGLLEEAVGTADTVMKSGTIVTTESRGKEIERYDALDEGDEPTSPIVVLVDGGSASAAEILAGALQDNERALIIGGKTFGKGSVQTVFELGDGSALKLTIARYFTPNGISIQAQGITPDIEVPSKVQEAEGEGKKTVSVREADLSGHLKSERSVKGRGKPLTAEVKRLLSSGIVEKNIELAKQGTIKDIQKQVALDFIKALGSSSSLDTQKASEK
jgi:carboxyl-terminal processing protease